MKKRRLLAHPLMTLGLLFVWLLLVDDFTSVGHWILGTVLALSLSYLTDHWWPPLLKIHSWKSLFVFMTHMLTDIVKANLDVARLILGSTEKLDPSYIEVPYELENELGIFMLASAISLAPGTVATSVDWRKKRLQVHALHCEDSNALIAEIKQRYEQPLLEVFPCSK
ncbi:Na+/H+ antiporter subunit E [Pseudomonas sp. F1_0610]|uniref:Na+/H+ antiporter subunit E n=1 Tax=Pseudomonas sp. F1_0610 TaxID=3114284 RepID=UPI0039C3CF7D